MQHTFVQHILPANSCIANELGERLYAKMTELVIPQIQEAISNITKEDSISYVYNLTINRTYDGYLREFVVYSLPKKSRIKKSLTKLQKKSKD